MQFSEFGLDEKIVESLTRAGYSESMPVQEQALQYTLQGRDVFVQSQTGTGKTAAFLVSIFALLRGDTLKDKKAMIIAPTRELAVQIENEANLLSEGLDLRICSFYGGVGYVRQEQYLQNGVDIMIGTPGRILDFQQSGKINFKQIGIFVIDEADRLFDMGFLPDITRMLRSLSSDSSRRTMLFSATLSREVRGIAREFMDNPAEVEITPEHVAVDAVSQELYHVSMDEKMSLLLGVLKKENPKNALIFTNMKYEARTVAERLKRNGYPCEYLSGDLPQGKRSKVVDDVKKGKVSYLVATDVAARGIHIDDLELVINYDLPEHCENYVHRIGRTARAGKTGKAVSLACENYIYGLQAIEDFTKVKIPTKFADAAMFVEDKSAGENFSQFRQKKRSTSRDNGRSGRSGRSNTTRRPSSDHRSDRMKTSQGQASRPDRTVERTRHEPRRTPPVTTRRDHPESFRPAGNHNQRTTTRSAPKIVQPVAPQHQKAASKQKKTWLKKVVRKIFG